LQTVIFAPASQQHFQACPWYCNSTINKQQQMVQNGHVAKWNRDIIENGEKKTPQPVTIEHL
jgi:hypothetical protein